MRVVVERLVRTEVTLRRQRQWAALLVGVLIGAVAVADTRLWPGISSAFGYAAPIALGAYVFGVRVGVQLAVLCMVLKRLAAVQAFGDWWLYTGSALGLAQSLLLAVGAGLLGRAMRRLERHAMKLRRLHEVAHELAGMPDAAAVLRRGVEASVALAGADGAFAATAADGGWRTDALYAGGRWLVGDVLWRPGGAGASVASAPESPPGQVAPAALRPGVELAVPIPCSAFQAPLSLIVFRAAPRSFEEATREVLGLLARHVAAGLEAAHRHNGAGRAHPAERG